MNEQKITIFMGVPTMYMALLDAATRNPERPPLRYGCSGGSAIPVAVIDRFREVFGAEIYEGYGLTETSPVATFNHIGVTPAGRHGRTADLGRGRRGRRPARSRTASSCCRTASSARSSSAGTCCSRDT